jgi:imidazolonepropionase-like amidohydrolase
MREEWQAWGLPESVLPRLDGVEEAMARSVKIARAAGITIGSGSDLLGTAQRRRGLELVIRASIEGAMEALVSATATNAKILRRSETIGTLEVGKNADVVALDGDPLADPAVFDDMHRVAVVVKDGIVYKDRR